MATTKDYGIGSTASDLHAADMLGKYRQHQAAILGAYPQMPSVTLPVRPELPSLTIRPAANGGFIINVSPAQYGSDEFVAKELDDLDAVIRNIFVRYKMDMG